MKKVFHKALITVLVTALVLTTFPLPAFAEEGTPAGDEGQNTAKRTILLYDCGSDLETEAGLASFNLRQILKAKFSADDDVRVIVMTGGADKWHMNEDELVFPEGVYVPEDAVEVTGDDPETSAEGQNKTQISNVYNQIWEAKGADAPENAGKLVLVDGDGVKGDGVDAKRGKVGPEAEEDPDYYPSEEDYEWMCDPEVLKAFINYGAENYPAEKYDLIIWDHGGGPDGGFCSDVHDPSHGFEMIEMHEMADVFADNRVVDENGDGTQDGRFDFVDFDACLMSSAEIVLTLSDYMDYYIASPEVEPGYGQDYQWLNMVGRNPDIDTFTLGKEIVDRFHQFYRKGEGAGQDGTLAVIDMNGLMEGGFVEGLSVLNSIMQDEVFLDQYYYDEFRSFKGSIRYGDLDYYDLGNLLSQLSYVFEEADYEDLNEGGTITDTNNYSEVCKDLMNLLDDPYVVYAKSTSGIRTNEQFYRDSSGKIQKGTQGTSGLYICFEPLAVPGELFSHHWCMDGAINKMDQDDPRTELLRSLGQTMILYGLVYHSGTAVTEMVNSGIPRDEIDYAAVKEYWETHEDKYGKILWEEYIDKFINGIDLELFEGRYPDEEEIGGDKEEWVKKWLGQVILQQRDEAVLKSKIETENIETKAGTGCRITLNDINKRAIDGVTLDLIAEIPYVRAFMKDPAHEDYMEDFKDLSTDLTIGTIKGNEVFDVDPLRDGYEKVIDWLFESKSEWTLDPPGDKWYALQYPDGTLHVAAPDVAEDEIDIPAGYFTTETYEDFVEKEDAETGEVTYELEPKQREVCHEIYLVYKKGGNGKWALSYIYIMQENGGWRGIPVSEFKGEMDLVPLIGVDDGFGDIYLPATDESFKLSPETIGQLEVKYVDVNEIPDIDDTDGDGRRLHSKVTVNNIYGHHLDITDIVNLISIKGAKVVLSRTSFTYNGKVHKPAVKTIGGKQLKAGTDYTIKIKNSKGKVVTSPKAAGTYTIAITGKGGYKGTTTVKYKINKAANPLKIKAKTAVIKRSKLKKKVQTLKVAKAIGVVKKGQGTKTYKLVSAKKGKKSFKKYFKVSAKTGKVTIKKNKKMKKGIYKVKIKVRAAGNANYKASAWKTVTTRVRVK